MARSEIFHNGKTIGRHSGWPRDLRDAGPSSPVKTYKLSDEELKAVIEKYGPPKQPRNIKKYEYKKMTVAEFVKSVPREELKGMLSKYNTISKVAAVYQVAPVLISYAMKLYGLGDGRVEANGYADCP